MLIWKGYRVHHANQLPNLHILHHSYISLILQVFFGLFKSDFLAGKNF